MNPWPFCSFMAIIFHATKVFFHVFNRGIFYFNTVSILINSKEIFILIESLPNIVNETVNVYAFMGNSELYNVKHK